MIGRGRKTLIARLKSRRTRPGEGRFLVEGVRGAEEALDAGVEVVFAVVAPAISRKRRGTALTERLSALAIDLERVSDGELGEMADTEAPQGVLLVCEEPRTALSELGGTGEGAPLRLLALDGLQDPGNAGTLIRAAAAFDLDGVVALDGTVDLWNPKVVRAAAGAAFRLPVVRTSWEAYDAWIREREAKLLVADPGGADVRSVEGGGARPRWSLLIGNEGAGPRREVKAAASRLVSIPMPGGTESLNAGVAGAILLYELTRRETLA